MTVAYLVKSVSILGGEPTDMLIRDGVIAAVGAHRLQRQRRVLEALAL